jgi:hypothetical protein
MLLESAEPTRVVDLHRRGIQRVRVVKKERLAALIHQSLDRAIETHLLELTDEERAALVSNAITELDRRRQAEQGTAAWMGEFQTENEALGQEIVESVRAGAPNFGRSVDLDALSAVIGGLGITTVGETVRIAVAVSGFLRSEESRLRNAAAKEQQQKIDLLERRLARLNETLRRTEQELQYALQHAQTEEGIESIYRSIQGIRESQQDFQKKWAMLSDIFNKNVELRKSRVEAGQAAVACA